MADLSDGFIALPGGFGTLEALEQMASYQAVQGGKWLDRLGR